MQFFFVTVDYTLLTLVAIRYSGWVAKAAWSEFAELCVNLRVLMHWYACKSLQNTLGGAVEQLAQCLANQAKSAVVVKVQLSCNASAKDLKCNMNL